MHILITRPKHQSLDLIQGLEALQHTVYALPTILIKDCSQDPSHLNTLKKLAHMDLAIFQSANAVYCSLPHWPETTRLPIIAIGQATEKALQQFKKTAITPRHPSTEGLLALPELQSTAIINKSIGVFSGRDPKPQLTITLRARHARVSQAFCYQRSCPPPLSVEQTQNLINQDIDTLVCTSKSALSNLMTMLPKSMDSWLKSKRLIVVSQSMQQVAQRAGFQKIHQVNNALNQNIIAFIKQHSG